MGVLERKRERGTERTRVLEEERREGWNSLQMKTDYVKPRFCCDEKVRLQASKMLLNVFHIACLTLFSMT